MEMRTVLFFCKLSPFVAVGLFGRPNGVRTLNGGERGQTG